MAQMHRLSRQDARRIAVRAQFLTGERPADLLTLVRRLTTLQLDPVSAIAPSADLVTWSKLGSSYQPKHLQDALADRRLIELRAFLRPAEDIALYRAAMAAWTGNGRLVSSGIFQPRLGRGQRPMPPRHPRPAPGGRARSRRERSPTPATWPWESTGWTNNKNVIRLLDFMVARGEVAVAGRKGRDRLWDLAERVYPDHPVIPVDEAESGTGPQAAARSRHRPADRAEAVRRAAARIGEPAVVEGVRGEWRVDPAYLDGTSGPPEPFAARAALLSPFDWLVV